MDKTKRRKTRLLIMPGYQARLVFFVVLAGFVCAAFNGYLYHAYVSGSYDFILKNSTLPQDLIAQRYDDLLFVGLGLAAATLLITFVIAVWALAITHRAAGAVYHIGRVVDEVRRGNITSRVRLREKDEFQSLANAFNLMLDELQQSTHRQPTS